jgi:5-methyltetrahydrofolate--homocysteine methyltransferase
MPALYYPRNYNYTTLRRQLRNNPTFAEQRLWQYLRKRRFLGLKFRRQESLGRYIVDFFCYEKMLVVEVDGSIHNIPEQKEYDRIRTEFLQERNINVVRFTNDEVLYNIEYVLKRLEREILAPPLAPPTGRGIGQLPPFGRDVIA